MAVFLLIKAFVANQRGATALEYCFIATLVSIVAVGAMTSIGVQTNTLTAGVLPGLTAR